MLVAVLALACAPPAGGPVGAPRADDPASVATVGAWATYLGALDDRRALDVIGDAATRVRGDPQADPAARELLLTWVLDAEIRRATADRRELRDLARAVGPSLSGDELPGAIVAVVGRPLEAWAAQREGSARLDLGPALQWFGLAFTDTPERRILGPDPGASPIARRRGERWLGG